MNTELKERQDAIIALLGEFGQWNERFDFIMMLGSEVPPMPEQLRTPQTIISGCISRTYFRTFVADGHIHCDGWSNAAVVDGLTALCHKVFDGITVEELACGGDVYFHTQSGLMAALTPARQQALQTMIQRIYMLVV